MTSFTKKVLAAVSRIPKGQTRTYREVARMAGSPRAYRAVGNILNSYDPKEIKVPCHRVVRSDLPAPRPNTYFVYAILCNNSSIYIGQTQNIQDRWLQHRDRTASEYTKKYGADKLIHYEKYSTRGDAVKREKELKTGFGRKWLKREWEAGRTRQAGGTPGGYRWGRARKIKMLKKEATR